MTNQYDVPVLDRKVKGNWEDFKQKAEQRHSAGGTAMRFPPYDEQLARMTGRVPEYVAAVLHPELYNPQSRSFVTLDMAEIESGAVTRAWQSWQIMRWQQEAREMGVSLPGIAPQPVAMSEADREQLIGEIVEAVTPAVQMRVKAQVSVIVEMALRNTAARIATEVEAAVEDSVRQAVVQAARSKLL